MEIESRQKEIDFEPVLVAIIPKNWWKTTDDLKKRGFQVNQGKGSFSILLPKKDDSSTEDYSDFEIPDGLKKAFFKINGFESGLGGQANIICGMQGARMNPYYINKGIACFSKVLTLMMVRYLENQQLQIIKYEILESEKMVDVLRLEKKIVWEGLVTNVYLDIPLRYWVFRDVALIAIERSKLESEPENPMFVLEKGK
jgi:hypothetical protein